MGKYLDILRFLSSKTILHFSITSGGTIINGVLGLAFYVIVARTLGPAAFGIFSIAIAAQAVIVDIADLGVDSGIIRFVGKYHSFDKSKALKFIKLGLEMRLAVWFAILAAGWFMAPFIATTLFLKEELILPLRLSLIGAGGAMLFSLSTHAIQAYQKFWAWSVLNIAANGLRLLAVVALIATLSLNLNQTLIIYITLPFMGFFISFLILPNYLAEKEERSVMAELFSYSKWVAIVGILTATGARLDTFISARLLTVSQVGIYAAASQITQVFPQIIFALATVVAPKLASMNTDRKAIGYLKKLQLLVLGLCAVGLLGLPIGIIVIPVLGQSYLGVIYPFAILLLAQLIFLLALPSHQAIFYYFAKPRIFVWMSVGQFLIAGIGGWFLISNFGIMGAAFAVLSSNLFNLIVSVLWVLKSFSKGGSK